MSIPIKILGIAPYEELNNSMNIVSQQFPEIDSDIFTADLEDGQRLALELSDDQYDAIISRGGTADLLRQTVAMPVIDVSISIYDILGAIRLANNYTENFAIVGYASITETAHLLCDILEYNIKIVTLDNNSDADTVLDLLNEENFELILCDAITNRLALSKSINTILITSGFESIKRAYQEALTITKYLKKEAHEKLILQAALENQEQEQFIFDQDFQIKFSTLPASLEQAVTKYLKGKENLDLENHFYHTICNKMYSLLIKRVTIEKVVYYSCIVKNSTPPIINNRFGILYQKREEVAEDFKTKLLFTKFIPEETKQKLQKINQFYQAILIFGESGTAKTSIAYQAYLDQKNHNHNLITIDSKLMNEKMWKFLVNSANGPLVNTNNTILFENVEQLSVADAEQLITIVKNTKLLQRNNLLLTYNTNQANDENIYSLLHTGLNCASIYTPALKERKHELSTMVTILLNKTNIECNSEVIGFEPKAMQEFLNFDWPGNLNQLQAAIKELVVNSKSHYISEHQVVQLLRKEQVIQNFSNNFISPVALKNAGEQPTLFDYTKQIILSILDQNNGNQTKTAEQLAISRTTLWRYLKDDN